MPQVFGPSANTLAKFSLVVFVFLAVGGLCALDAIHRSPYVRYTELPRSQPVPFSHKHHASLGIDCRYCHTTVEDSSGDGAFQNSGNGTSEAMSPNPPSSTYHSGQSRMS